MGTNDSLIKQLRLKIAFLIILRHELFFLTILGFLLGIITLIVRVIFIAPRQGLLWLLLCLLPGTIWAITRAVKETPSRKALSALFDEKNHCGGLLMTSSLSHRSRVDLPIPTSWQTYVVRNTLNYHRYCSPPSCGKSCLTYIDYVSNCPA